MYDDAMHIAIGVYAIYRCRGIFKIFVEIKSGLICSFLLQNCPAMQL